MKPTKVSIPEGLKADLPHTTWGRVLSATPVVMAVGATMLAGLASSEMTRAQYDRSLGAQQQSKAGDQWSFFQAKRLRGAIQRNTADLLQTMADVRAFDPSALKQAAGQMRTQASQPGSTDLGTQLLGVIESPGGQQALAFLRTREAPAAPTGLALDPQIRAAMEGVETSMPDPEMKGLLAQVSLDRLDATLKAARDQAQVYDAATKPINQAVDQIDNLLAREAALRQRPAAAGLGSAGPEAGPPLVRDFTAARLRYAALRYEVEARLNQTIANLYELQVRKSNISAEHHHARSQRFFFGMLAAQAGVIISTLAMAAKNRNLLWSFAAGAGLVAIAFAIYVYLYI
ncbi:MAG TPA: DUF4337 family protein [Dongiaceae bacterium]|nr:DUF4337 family protein [Dongiaceae bacterium]